MILIGQFDSPFVRRVGVALRLYGMSFEHWPWSTFGDAERLAAYNPLRRVPVLVLADGTSLIESGAILDYLDELAGPARALMPDHGAARQAALRVCALATGLADKAVGLVYERVLHSESSVRVMERGEIQIRDTLAVLEAARAAAGSAFWFGAEIGHADIAVACTLRFLREAHAGLFDDRQFMALAEHCSRCEQMPAFIEISQTFLPP